MPYINVGCLLGFVQAAVIWLLGEFGELVEEGPYILEPLCASYNDETERHVRMELLTAGTNVDHFFCYLLMDYMLFVALLIQPYWSQFVITFGNVRISSL